MYVVNRSSQAGRIFWWCAKRRSCSRGVTTLDDAVVSNRAAHNHPVDTAEIKAPKIRSASPNNVLTRSLADCNCMIPTQTMFCLADYLDGISANKPLNSSTFFTCTLQRKAKHWLSVKTIQLVLGANYIGNLSPNHVYN